MNLLNYIRKSPKFLFAAETKAPKSNKALKIQDHEIFINVKYPSGFYDRVPCRVGTTLYDAFKDAKIPISGNCGNQTAENFYSVFKKPVENSATDLSCQECMCMIESPWFEKIPMNDIEKKAL